MDITRKANPFSKRDELKRIVDEALGTGKTIIEKSLEPKEYYIYTPVWSISTEQLDKIRDKVAVTEITVDGGRILLTAKI